MTASDGTRRASSRPCEPAYAPSPRPVFDRPTHITDATVTRHIWGDDEAHQVADWIYASTDRIHAMVFGLAPGGRFLHSPEFRTVFGADEVFTVLRGRMILANPETGEVQPVEAGESVAFGRDTWHHAFAHGSRGAARARAVRAAAVDRVVGPVRPQPSVPRVGLVRRRQRRRRLARRGGTSWRRRRRCG